MRVPCLADRRDVLPVVGILALLLGLGTACSGLVAFELRSEEVAPGAHRPARTVLPGNADFQFAGGDRLGSDPSCRPPHASPPGAVVLASVGVDPREYLNKMAALRPRGPLTTPTTIDPYQASLNPAAYVGDFITTATPILTMPSALPRRIACRDDLS